MALDPEIIVKLTILIKLRLKTAPSLRLLAHMVELTSCGFQRTARRLCFCHFGE